MNKRNNEKILRSRHRRQAVNSKMNRRTGKEFNEFRRHLFRLNSTTKKVIFRSAIVESKACFQNDEMFLVKCSRYVLVTSGLYIYTSSIFVGIMNKEEHAWRHAVHTLSRRLCFTRDSHINNDIATFCFCGAAIYSALQPHLSRASEEKRMMFVARFCNRDLLN